MLRHPDYTNDRIRQLIQRIERKIYAERRWIDDLRFSGPVGRISYAEAQSLTEWTPAKPGDQYRPMWATFWFRAKATVPAEWKGKRVDLLWDSQSEATLWMDGRTIQGLNMTHGDRPDAILLDHAKGNDTLEFQIELACNHKFGVSTDGGQAIGAGVISPYHLRRAEIAVFNPKAWDLFHDATTLYQLYRELDKEGDVSEKSFAGLLLSELNRFCNEIDVNDETTWAPAQKILKDLYQHHNASRQFELTAIGHAHIDTAWLWPLAETWRKCERTFSSATTYMRDYPEYRFACSQAYQYAIIKQRNPDLYERIRKHIKTGQWVIVGGTWIEPDCNIPSGEALCRQFLLGQRYFEKEFGVRCKEFWNPDVFGYNGQLPQIMNLAGITRFLTQKLSWNRFNRPEHHTFTWQGIDGSEVLAHFPPADNYNVFMHKQGYSHITWVRDNAKLFKDHDRAHHGMMLYGFGDGGGGPTKAMFETIRRCEDLQGVPRTKQRSSDEFFDLLEKDLTDRPVQIGELYFEYHRGTYTSQALVKKNNRRAEFLMHDLELLLSMNASAVAKERDTLRQMWEVLLLNQFHDILPGSSIREVYEDSAKQFAELFATGESVVERVAGKGETALNTLAFNRTDVVERNGKLGLFRAAPFAAGTRGDATDKVSIEQKADRFILSNSQLHATFTSAGKLVSLVHRASGRETMSAPGNVFETYDDKPTQFDAWDVDPFHFETRAEANPAHSAKIIRADALRAELQFEQKLGQSSMLVQTVRLDAHAQRIEFHCRIDWRENETMLKVAFPINARAMNATYEMQFGNVERPTHYNNSFDLAKYEVPLHKWFDFGEHGFGCAILSDCKYGGSTFGNTMRLSLLRSPMSPDPTCDRGSHEFAFALMPHAGNWRDAGVVAEAFRFNVPLRFVGKAPEQSFATVSDANLILDTIKPAEDSDATVLRFYEPHGSRGVAKVTLARPITSATFCNVLEEDAGSVTVSGQTIEVPYTPYQVISVKVK